MLLCFGCNSQKCVSTYERVELTVDNFSKYVATQTNRVEKDSVSYATYFAYFKGADHCRFNDCTVTYSFVADTIKGATGTVPLTISGDGEAKPANLYIYGKTTNYVLKIEAVSGTVDVYSY